MWLCVCACPRQAGVHDGGGGPGSDGGPGASSLSAGGPGPGLPRQRTLLVLQPQELQRDLLPQTAAGWSSLNSSINVFIQFPAVT